MPEIVSSPDLTTEAKRRMHLVKLLNEKASDGNRQGVNNALRQYADDLYATLEEQLLNTRVFTTPEEIKKRRRYLNDTSTRGQQEYNKSWLHDDDIKNILLSLGIKTTIKTNGQQQKYTTDVSEYITDVSGPFRPDSNAPIATIVNEGGCHWRPDNKLGDVRGDGSCGIWTIYEILKTMPFPEIKGKLPKINDSVSQRRPLAPSKSNKKTSNDSKWKETIERTKELDLAIEKKYRTFTFDLIEKGEADLIAMMNQLIHTSEQKKDLGFIADYLNKFIESNKDDHTLVRKDAGNTLKMTHEGLVHALSTCISLTSEESIIELRKQGLFSKPITSAPIATLAPVTPLQK